MKQKKILYIIILNLGIFFTLTGKIFANVNIYNDTVTYGLSGGYEIPLGSFSSNLENGFSGGFYLDYQPSAGFMGSFLGWKYYFFESTFRYTYSSLKESPRSNIKWYSGDLGPVLYYPLFSWLSPYVAISGGGFYSTIKLDTLGEKDSNSGYLGRGKFGFMIPASSSLAFRIEGLYSYQHLSPSPYKSAAVGVSLSYNFSGDFGSRIEKNQSLLQIGSIKTSELFAIQYLQYNSQGIGSATIKNKGSEPLYNVRVDVSIDNITDEPKSTEEIPVLQPGDVKIVLLPVNITPDVFSISEERKIPLRLKVIYASRSSKFFFNDSFDITVYSKNALTWDNTGHLGSFIMPRDATVSYFTRKVLAETGQDGTAGIPKKIVSAMILFDAIRAHGIIYASDPGAGYSTAGKKNSIDYIQIPAETLKKKAGDCDDLTVLYCSMLESVGIPSAIATIPGHVFAAFDTGVPESCSSEISGDKTKYLVRGGTIWIPVEITRIGGSFMEAWREGSRESKQSGFAALDTAAAWEMCPPSDIGGEIKISLPDMKLLKSQTALDITEYKKSAYTDVIAALQNEIQANPRNVKALNSLGIAFGRQNMLKEAEECFIKALDLMPKYKQALTNMGNISMLKKDYKKASEYFSKSLTIDGEDADVLIGYSRAMFELGKIKDSESAYKKAVAKKPGLAMRYMYLAGRANQVSDRAADTSDRNLLNIWTE